MQIWAKDAQEAVCAANEQPGESDYGQKEASDHHGLLYFRQGPSRRIGALQRDGKPRPPFIGRGGEYTEAPAALSKGERACFLGATFFLFGRHERGRTTIPSAVDASLQQTRPECTPMLRDHPSIIHVTQEFRSERDGTFTSHWIVYTDLELDALDPAYEIARVDDLLEAIKTHLTTHPELVGRITIRQSPWHRYSPAAAQQLPK